MIMIVGVLMRLLNFLTYLSTDHLVFDNSVYRPNHIYGDENDRARPSAAVEGN